MYPKNKYSTELIWNEKKTEVERIILPFQVVETINEPREKQKRLISPEIENYPKDWKNLLIWGDNKYIMSSLLPKFAGKINLMYIDPPFATGADFSINMKVGDVSWTKEPSVIEELVYRDTWGKGLGSYLQMMYDRLVLMRELLAENGSIYVHLDWHVGHYVKIIMDELFGRENFRNEVVWRYRRWTAASDTFQRMHDTILWYTKSEKWIFNRQYEPFSEKTVIAPYKRKVEGGRAVQDKTQLMDRDPARGVAMHDVWDIAFIHPVAHERLNFPTQKPEALLERIIKAFSDEGDLVADFFCGSGTTLAIAEKLGRRWIGADLSKFAIHTTRKRLLDIPFCRPYEILNLGNYQKYKFIENGHPPVERYLKFILELYRAQYLQGYAFLHGRKDRRLVHIAGVDSIVTEREVRDAAEECANALHGKALDVLGWDFEMGLDELVERIGLDYNLNIKLVQIPKDALEVESPRADKTLELELKDFIIANMEYIPEKVREKIKQFTDYIDYWAVDFDYKNDTFHNMWQSFRTKKHPNLDKKCQYTYGEDGIYKVLVKVIDIFGNDTNKLLGVVI